MSYWTPGDKSGSETLNDLPFPLGDTLRPEHVNELRVASKDVSIDARYYGLVGDGGTDNTVAFQAMLDDMPSSGGLVDFPAGDFLCTGMLDANAHQGLRIRGRSGLSGAGTKITFTGTGARFLDGRSAYIRLEDLYIRYTNAGFTGKLVDFSGGAGVGDSAYGSVDRCILTGFGASGAAALLSFNRAIIHHVSDCYFGAAVVAIKGGDGDAGDYSQPIDIFNSTFVTTTIPLKNAGHWTVRHCTFESSIGIIYRQDPAHQCFTLNFFDTCWAGDVTGVGQPSIQFAGDVLNIEGVCLMSDSVTTLIEITGNNASCIKIEGNYLGYAGKAVDFGATTGHSGVSIRSNKYANIGTRVAGTIPAGAFIEYDNRIGIGCLPDDDAVLALGSTTKGTMRPKMTTTQRNAITTPTEALSIYNLTTHQNEVYNGSSWIAG